MTEATISDCACGRSLHYNDPEIGAIIRDISDTNGEFITINIGERAFKVQRHYIALHGIKAQDLLAARVPCEEITEKSE